VRFIAAGIDIRIFARAVTPADNDVLSGKDF
jgi:hypothetical protein